jgi:glutamate synthase domain-containing protein 2
LLKVSEQDGYLHATELQGAQVFEAGLADEVVDRCFSGTTTRIQGADFEGFLYRDLERVSTIRPTPHATDNGDLVRAMVNSIIAMAPRHTLNTPAAMW